MAVQYTSENVEVPADVENGTVAIDLYQPFTLPNGEQEIPANFHMVRLNLTEDQAVEVATLLLMGVTKLRGARLSQEL